MRLGFWNRLAIVASALALIVAPLWLIINQNAINAKYNQDAYVACSRIADGITDFSKQMAMRRECDADWRAIMELHAKRPFLTEWSPLAAGTAAVCAIIYALIWATVRTIRWVWAGRKSSHSA